MYQLTGWMREISFSNNLEIRIRCRLELGASDLSQVLAKPHADEKVFFDRQTLFDRVDEKICQIFI